MGRQWPWLVGAALMLAWLAVSAYFVVSGAPVNLPPEVAAYLPHALVVLFAGILFFRFRKTTGNPELDRANLYAVGSGVALGVLLAFALFSWGSDGRAGQNWLLAAIAWSPVAILMFFRYRAMLK